MKKLFCILCSPFFAVTLFGYTVNGSTYTTDGSQPDVQAACTAATAGSVVEMPSGTFTWTSGITITNAITLAGTSTAAPVSPGQGPGVSSTNIVRSSGTNEALISVTPDSDIPIRVTGLNINNNAGSEVSSANLTAVYIAGSETNPIKQIRIDNCTFNTGTQVVWWNGGAYGLVDHCYFLNCWIGILNNGGESDLGDLDWARDDYQAGSLNFPFTEDCIFVWNISGQPGSPWVTYHEYGGRSVLRHCTIDSTATPNITGPVDCHGNQTYWSTTANNQRGTIRFEFYNNTVQLGAETYQIMDLRGGSSFIHDNTFTTTDGDTPNICDFRDEEDDPGNTPGIPVLSLVQWPCQDQITATFVWNNTFNGTPSNTVGVGTFGNSNASDGDPFYIKANRDFWLSAPSSTTTTTYPLPPNGPTVAQYPSPYALLQTSAYTPAPYPHPLQNVNSSSGPTPTPTASPSPTPIIIVN